MTIWHNSRCSKSRAAIEALDEKSVSYSVKKYLDDNPSKEEIVEVFKKLGFKNPREMMRTKETEYQEMDLANENKSDDDLINAMVDTPKLIERPIAVTENSAAIGRPLENILDLI